MTRSTLLALLASAALLGAAPRELAAANFLVQSGVDNAPYSFLPSLPRGNRETLYAFTGEDDEGNVHDFETYVRMDLPGGVGAEDVVEAYLWLYYSFDFTGFGDSAGALGEIHCHPVQEAWDPEVMDWQTRPAIGPAFDVQRGIDGLGLVWCDVTAQVRRWLSGAPNHGIALTNPTERLIGMASFEATDTHPNFRPSLVVSTTGPSPEVEAVALHSRPAGCAGQRVAAAGRAFRGMLRCHARDSEGSDPAGLEACLGRAQARYQARLRAAAERADRRGGFCVPEDEIDVAAIRAEADSGAALLLAELGPDPGASATARRALLSGARMVGRQFKAERRYVKSGRYARRARQLAIARAECETGIERRLRRSGAQTELSLCAGLEAAREALLP